MIDTNKMIRTLHCQYDHPERWAVLKEWLNDDLGSVVVYGWNEQKNAWNGITDRGVFVAFSLDYSVMITAYFPCVGCARFVYDLAMEDLSEIEEERFDRVYKESRRKEFEFLKKSA